MEGFLVCFLKVTMARHLHCSLVYLKDIVSEALGGRGFLLETFSDTHTLSGSTWVFCSFFKHCIVWRWGDFAAPQLLVTLRHCINTYLNAPDQQTVKTSTFIEALTVSEEQLDNWSGVVSSTSYYLPSSIIWNNRVVLSYRFSNLGDAIKRFL